MNLTTKLENNHGLRNGFFWGAGIAVATLALSISTEVGGIVILHLGWIIPISAILLAQEKIEMFKGALLAFVAMFVLELFTSPIWLGPLVGHLLKF